MSNWLIDIFSVVARADNEFFGLELLFLLLVFCELFEAVDSVLLLLLCVPNDPWKTFLMNHGTFMSLVCDLNEISVDRQPLQGTTMVMKG